MRLHSGPPEFSPQGMIGGDIALASAWAHRAVSKSSGHLPFEMFSFVFYSGQLCLFCMSVHFSHVLRLPAHDMLGGQWTYTVSLRLAWAKEEVWPERAKICFCLEIIQVGPRFERSY